MSPTIITVANLKGGSGKTTTAAYLAHAYAAQGRNVLLVDSDPQGSALYWSEAAGWAIPTISLPVKNLHTRLAGVLPATVDTVIIDTPPLEEQAGIVASALRTADAIVITMAPTMVEFSRLGDVWRVLDDLDSVRSQPAKAAVLLNRTVPRANSTNTFRELIEQDGHTVLATVIPRREHFAQSFGDQISDLGPYAEVAAELLALEGNR